MIDDAAVPAELREELSQRWEILNTVLDADDRAALAAARAAEPVFTATFTRVLCGSRFVSRELESHPGLLATLLTSGDLQRGFDDTEYSTRCARALEIVGDEAGLLRALRDLRRREMLRIVWRELLHHASLAATTRELSLLAAAMLEAALSRCHAELAAKHGEPIGRVSGAPQRLVVLGMGKLGAQELNLSSDIDLIFAYSEPGETNGARSLSNHEFFIRLGQKLIRALDAVTAEGFVFRIDMRLRPYGEGGALALHFDAMEQYYQDQGRDWERYAMIKAAVVAGDRVAGAALLTLLAPFTYRRYIDYGAIEALRRMKGMIAREVARRGLAEDVKLGPGGIREVEFIAQSFQLIRGGREPRLRERSLLAVLETLAELGLLPSAVVRELREAYVFLRDTEHALQAWDDAQTQALPADEAGRARLAFVRGFASWEAFAAALDAHRAQVARHFADVIAEPLTSAPGALGDAAGTLAAVWAAGAPQQELQDILQEAGYHDPVDTLRRVTALHDSQRAQLLQGEGRERLDRFVPRLLAAVTRTERPSETLARCLSLVEAVLRRSAYLVLLEENPAALAQFVRLCAASPWIASELANHPLLLDELIDPRLLNVLPERARIDGDLQQHMLRVPLDDLEAQMEALRHFKLAHGLRCAASEVSGALPLMKVSDYLTWLAEAILQHVLALAWHGLVARHGAPQRATDVPCDPDFVIVAYGKLGGIELGHGSDLDLVFLHDADPQLSTDGARPIENSLFFTRLGQRIIHVLTTYTTQGPLYEVDMRLRPSGVKGLLVSSFAAFRDYQFNEAWTWEHQALVRARPVAGCARLAARFEALRRELLARERNPQTLRQDVLEMRAKMRSHLLKPSAPGLAVEFHLKQGEGGIVDIEFLVQYAALAWSREHPLLTVWTDNIRILEALGRTGLVSAGDCALLTEAYKAYRVAVHRLALQTQGEMVPDTEFATERATVRRVWTEVLAGN